MLDHETMVTLGKMGAAAALGLGALGSALGCGTAGMSAIAVHFLILRWNDLPEWI